MNSLLDQYERNIDKVDRKVKRRVPILVWTSVAILLFLKLTEAVVISWWWVFSPLLIAFIAGCLVYGTIGIWLAIKHNG